MHICFDQRVVLVTGAAQEIGQAIALGFAQAGATVYVADRDEAGIHDFAHAHGMNWFSFDVGARVQCHDCVNQIVREQGKFDILVNAAGGVRGQVGGHRPGP